MEGVRPGQGGWFDLDGRVSWELGCWAVVGGKKRLAAPRYAPGLPSNRYPSRPPACASRLQGGKRSAEAERNLLTAATC